MLRSALVMPLPAWPLFLLPASRLFPDMRATRRNYGPSTSRYTPHQGDREKARRVRQMGKA